MNFRPCFYFFFLFVSLGAMFSTYNISVVVSVFLLETQSLFIVIYDVMLFYICIDHCGMLLHIPGRNALPILFWMTISFLLWPNF